MRVEATLLVFPLLWLDVEVEVPAKREGACWTVALILCTLNKVQTEAREASALRSTSLEHSFIMEVGVGGRVGGQVITAITGLVSEVEEEQVEEATARQTILFVLQQQVRMDLAEVEVEEERLVLARAEGAVL